MKTIEEIYEEINETEKNYNKLNQYESAIWLAVAALMIALLSTVTNYIVVMK